MALEHLELDVPQVKKYLRIDHNSDDELLEMLIEASKEQASAYINHNFTRYNNGMVERLTIPFTVKLACLKMIASWYEHRDDVRTSENLGGTSVSLGEVPWDARELLQPYRRMAWL